MDAILQLLVLYKFDLGDRYLAEIAADWRDYDLQWLRLAITESLYRGRYKAISVEQILETWRRKQAVLCKFDFEFERLIWKNTAFEAIEGIDSCEGNNSNLKNSSDSKNLDTNNSAEILMKLKSFCQI